MRKLTLTALAILCTQCADPWQNTEEPVAWQPVQLPGVFTQGSVIMHGIKRQAPAAAPQGTVIANIESGQKIYTKYCLPCHGKTGAGDGPRAHLLSRKPVPLGSWPDQQEGKRFFLRVRTGSDVMPAWQSVLTPQEMASVVAYIRTFAKQDTSGKHKPTKAY